MTDSPTNTESELREILNYTCFRSKEYPEAIDKALNRIMHLIDQHTADAVTAARIDELKRFTSSTAKHKKLETWQDWSWRVVKYCQDRLAELQARNTQ